MLIIIWFALYICVDTLCTQFMFYRIYYYFERLSFDNHASFIHEICHHYRGYNEDYTHMNFEYICHLSIVTQLKLSCYVLFSISLPIRLSKWHLYLFRTIDLAIQVINESFWIKWNEKTLSRYDIYYIMTHDKLKEK